MKSVLIIAVAVLTLGASLAVYGLMRMRQTMEKMVALDVLTTIVTGGLLLAALLIGNPMILDIALVYAVLSFGAVMLVARYQEGGF